MKETVIDFDTALSSNRKLLHTLDPRQGRQGMAGPAEGHCIH